MSPVIVYSKPNCQQCRATYRSLDGKGIDYTVIDITEEPLEVAEGFRDQGLFAAPIVVTSDNTWSGFRPDLIATLA